MESNNIQSLYLFLLLVVVGLASSSAGAGKLKEIGGLNSYVSGSPRSRASVLLISDVFGYENPQLREFADKVASAGFYAVLPDFFRGDPYVNGTSLEDWLQKHKPEQGFEDAKPVIEALKSKGRTKIGTAGFCWGGKVAALLSTGEYNKASVLLHPSFVTTQDIERVEVPTAILGGEFDDITPPEKIQELGAALKAKPEIDSYVKIFGGVGHGWTIDYNETDPYAVLAAQKARNITLFWMIKYLK